MELAVKDCLTLGEFEDLGRPEGLHTYLTRILASSTRSCAVIEGRKEFMEALLPSALVSSHMNHSASVTKRQSFTSHVLQSRAGVLDKSSLPTTSSSVRLWAVAS